MRRSRWGATASTTFNEPYNIARKFASLDWISNGRAAWNIVTSGYKDDALHFSRTEHVPHALRYERAEEFVDVVRALWDSWDDDAFLRNWKFYIGICAAAFAVDRTDVVQMELAPA